MTDILMEAVKQTYEIKKTRLEVDRQTVKSLYEQIAWRAENESSASAIADMASEIAILEKEIYILDDTVKILYHILEGDL